MNATPTWHVNGSACSWRWPVSDLAQQWCHETESGWVLRFPQPAQRLSMNDRLHWGRRNELARAWKEAAYWWARSNRLPKLLQPCTLRVTFPVNDRRRRDGDNPAPTVKAIVDGLVLAGMWSDDTPEWVETSSSRFSVDGPRGVVVVELIRR